ncbi:MAG: diacylglycerol kinase [Congregibacter sp.]
MKPTERGLAHLFLATQYSIRGLQAAWRHEESFRQEAVLALMGLPLALWLARDMADFLFLTSSLLLLLLAELGNSAIEAVVDRVSAEHHELSGRAKDLGSAMVFMAILIVIVCWSSVLLSILYLNP